ncbi:hypothetical protein Tco_1194457 [Tanacetum coccineum]
MEISIADQIALDDALVAPANRLKIGKCNLRLSSDVTSKEATLQVVYDVLKLTPFYKAFQVSADVPEIYMQELWASAYVHNRSIENKNTKKGNEMYYPRFTKLVVNFVMDKDPSIPRRNKVNWHYARDDPMFTTINVISRNEDTQLYETILPVPLTNEDIRNSESYKEYYAIASKTKGSKKKADTDTTTKQKPPTVPKEKKEKKLGKGKQKAKDGSGADEGTSVSPGVPDAPDYDSDDVISWKSSEDDQADDKNDDDENAQDDANDDKNDDDENVQDDDDEAQTESDIANEIEGVDVEGEKSDEDATDEEDQGNETDKDTNANLEGRDDVMTDSLMYLSGFVSNHDDPNQGYRDVDALFRQTCGSHTGYRLKALEDNFSELKQTNQYAEALSSIPGIVDQYLANKLKEAVDVVV